jgi:hypothetical protein
MDSTVTDPSPSSRRIDLVAGGEVEDEYGRLVE